LYHLASKENRRQSTADVGFGGCCSLRCWR